jgi:hypothetical protein
VSSFYEQQLAGLQPSLLPNKIHVPDEAVQRLFASIVVRDSGCWEWVGHRVREYGHISIRALQKSPMLVHRVTYQMAKGPIERKDLLHHQIEQGICAIGPPCCNPDHTQKTNSKEHLRELSPNHPAYKLSRIKYCKNGHPYDGKNKRVNRHGRRECRACDNEKHARQDAEQKALKPPKEPRPIRSHCKKGHELVGANVQIVKRSDGEEERRCAQCNRDAQQALRDRKASENPPAPPGGKIKEFCKRGHPMTEDNLSHIGDQRRCKKCAVIRQTEYEQRKSPPQKVPSQPPTHPRQSYNSPMSFIITVPVDRMEKLRTALTKLPHVKMPAGGNPGTIATEDGGVLFFTESTMKPGEVLIDPQGTKDPDEVIKARLEGDVRMLTE